MPNQPDNLRDLLQFGLADRLAKSLHVAGMTNLDMAKVLEVSPNTVSNYINGNTQPRKLYLRMIEGIDRLPTIEPAPVLRLAA